MHAELENLLSRYPVLTNLNQAISSSFDLLYTCFKNQKKLLLCGNGGSASDSDHIAGELLKGFKSLRRLLPDEHKLFGDTMAGNLQGSLPAISLPSLTAANTAFANDCNPDYIYAQLTYGLGNEGDVLWAISTSGNSANVVLAAQVAKSKKMAVISLTGRGGGQLKSLSDVCINVPEDETYKIQELHLPVYHCLCLMLESDFFE